MLELRFIQPRSHFQQDLNLLRELEMKSLSNRSKSSLNTTLSPRSKCLIRLKKWKTPKQKRQDKRWSKSRRELNRLERKSLSNNSKNSINTTPSLRNLNSEKLSLCQMLEHKSTHPKSQLRKDSKVLRDSEFHNLSIKSKNSVSTTLSLKNKCLLKLNKWRMQRLKRQDKRCFRSNKELSKLEKRNWSNNNKSWANIIPSPKNQNLKKPSTCLTLELKSTHPRSHLM